MASDELKENPLLPKLKKLYDLKIENDDELLEGLKILSLIFKENTIRHRRELRCSIEKQSLELRKSTLSEFKTAINEAKKVNDQAKAMNKMCHEMNERLSVTKCQTRELIEKTTKLQVESQKLQMKKKVADAFCEKFQVSREDRIILTGEIEDRPTANHDETVDINGQFLDAMDRLRNVENDCKLLLRLPHQTIGLETLENISGLCERAYERLFKWAAGKIARMIQPECEISIELAGAIVKLQERPVMLRLLLDEWRQARNQATETAFVDMIGAVPDQVTSDIDPLRYVGDLLAMVHQLVAGEREHWRSLWRLASLSGLSNSKIDNNSDLKNKDVDLYSSEYGGPETACDGLCKPLKLRMEQILVSEQDPLILYKIQHLVQFYKSTISQIMRTVDSEVCQLLGELQALSWRLFFSSLQSQIHGLLDKSHSADWGSKSPKSQLNIRGDTGHRLAPNASVKSALDLLDGVLTARDGSMLPNPTSKTELHQILQTVIDPVLQHCSLSATNAGPVEAAVYLCNCLYVCQSSLARFEYTDSKLEQIQGQLDANVDSLVSFQAGYVIKGAGLGDLYELINEQQQSSTGSIPHNLGERIPEAAFKKMMTQFDRFLAHPDSLTMPQVAQLQSTKLRDLVRKRAHDLVHNAYTRIYETVAMHTEQNDPIFGYSVNIGVLMPRTPDQVADLILNC